ncbi:MAG: farnesyl diphosphate synthase [Candidatus Firestonebacteria bacterium]
MNFKKYLNSRCALVDKALDKMMPERAEYPSIINQAMRYSVFAGGKRVRPVLVIMAAEALGYEASRVMPTACAMELIHTYSLIHDDLPCMDDDDYRRGKLTNHKVYGENMAVLGGDGLLTLAFELIAENAEIKGVNPLNVVKALRIIANGAGTRGMVGGQVVDIISENKKVSEPVLQYIHTHKTGALIRASILSGAVLCGANEREYGVLRIYGEHIGLIFQITDDILNVTGDEKKLGKAVGSDAKRKKMTYPSLFGLKQSREEVELLCEKAKAAVKPFGKKAEAMMALVDFLKNRDA